MAYYSQKDPDLEATEKIYRKIMSTGRDPGRSYATPTPHTSPGRKYVPPTPRRNKGTRKGYSRGGGAQRDTQMNRHFPDPSEALKRTYDGSSPHRGISPASTARTGPSVSSKRRAVTNSHSPAKTPTHQQYKKDKHLTGVPCEKKVLDSENLERWNQSYQALRLEKEWTELDQCRNMKRNSEIVRHRVDNMYMMSGSGIRLRPKYDVNEEELRQLKELSRARQKLRDGAMKNHSSRKGRGVKDENNKNSSKKETTLPEIHIAGDPPGDRSQSENHAEWASDPGSRPRPSPRSNHGDTDNENLVMNGTGVVKSESENKADDKGVGEKELEDESNRVEKDSVKGGDNENGGEDGEEKKEEEKNEAYDNANKDNENEGDKTSDTNNDNETQGEMNKETDDKSDKIDQDEKSAEEVTKAES